MPSFSINLLLLYKVEHFENIVNSFSIFRSFNLELLSNKNPFLVETLLKLS